jgi:hypothetical protein
MIAKLLLKSIKKNRRAIIALVLLCGLNPVFAQAKFEIAYGEKISLDLAKADSRFTITGPTGTMRLDANAINQYTFPIPGNYVIKVAQSHSHDQDCKHAPEEITVKVNPVRMVFDARNLTLSAPIQKNKPTDNIVVSIPVSIESYGHQPVKLNQASVQSAGIGSSIVARLNPAITTLPEGKHTLQYTLEGVATHDTYLMLDFIDANGQIQSILLSKPVKD